MCDFDKNLEIFIFWAKHMEKYAGNVRIKISCQNLSLWSSFWFLKFGYVLSSSIIVCISKFSRITKNWVEDAITFSVNNFEDMKKPLCTNSSLINSLQNVGCRFLIQLKCKPFLFFDTNFMCDFWKLLIKTDVLVHNFWHMYTRKSNRLPFLESTGYFL